MQPSHADQCGHIPGHCPPLTPPLQCQCLTIKSWYPPSLPFTTVSLLHISHISTACINCSTSVESAEADLTTTPDTHLLVTNMGLLVVVIMLLMLLVALPILVGCICLVIKSNRHMNPENDYPEKNSSSA